MFRGHAVRLTAAGEVVFADTGNPTASTWRERGCGHCGKVDTPEGHDGCLGALPGVMNACCGHGSETEAFVQFYGGGEARGRDALAWFASLGRGPGGSRPVAHFTADGRLSFRCPGCKEAHAVQVEAGHGPSCWGWNGDVVRPTLSPSVLVRSGHFTTGHDPERDGCWCTYNREHPDSPASFACVICHSFVEAGRIRFLDDCAHPLAGQTVELPPWETI